MGVHNLVTGLNGHGKTLYVVATKLRPLVDATVEYNGRQVPRRIMNGGIPELLLEHELVEVPEIDPETFVDEWATVIRKPGQPPVRLVRKVVVNSKSQAEGYVVAAEDDAEAVPLVCTALNWWAWCEPGDVIVIDECQRLFRPMASGRRVPKFVAQLETARHYGVEFIYMTQHPQLLHVNVRNLVGPHEDVRRIFGFSRCMVYQWDKVSNPDRINKATGKIWKHDKTAFGLYKSSQLHLDFRQRLPFALWVLVPALVALVVLGVVIKRRMTDRFSGAQPVAAAAPGQASPGAGGQPVPTSLAASASTGSVGSAALVKFPVMNAGAQRFDREPYADRGLQIEGGYSQGGKPYGIFGLVQDGQRIATVTLSQLVRAGYAYTEIGPCAGVLRFGDRERVLSCGPRVDSPALAAPGAASAPAV